MRLSSPSAEAVVESTRHGVALPRTVERAVLGVSVVVPMFNERDCVAKLVQSLERLDAALGERFDFEFVLVDDGSSDETVSLLQLAVAGQSRFRLVQHVENRGIAAAIQSGLRAARHEVVASLDSDGSYDPLLLAEMAPRLVDGVDVVTASPYHAEGLVENVPAWRLALSRLASRMYRVVCRGRLSCYTSCCRIYRRDTVAGIDVENEGFVGVAELLWRVLEQGGVVIEHPARLRSRVAGQSKMRVMRAATGHLRLMVRIAAVRLKLLRPD